MAASTHNSLARASSSYLRSAMHQPIQWHEWGDEAFEKAKRENKPILLDIGAVWCHWCHVMDRESYEDPRRQKSSMNASSPSRSTEMSVPTSTAAIRSRCRQSADRAAGRSPAFLCPTDGHFTAAPTSLLTTCRDGRVFAACCSTISDAYREKNADVSEQAQMVEGAIAHAESLTGKTGDFSAEVIQAIIESALKMFDENNGGFGSAPKFPHPSNLDLLIDQYVRIGSGAHARAANELSSG